MLQLFGIALMGIGIVGLIYARVLKKRAQNRAYIAMMRKQRDMGMSFAEIGNERILIRNQKSLLR